MGLTPRLSALLLLSIPVFVFAQTTNPQPTTDQPGYVFHANTHEVLTDVTVTDRDGNPVQGLPRSAFHIFDNERRQQLESFEEHTASQSIMALADTSPNLVSNSFLLHPPAAFNVILLDPTTIDIVDQMYLNQQLTKFVQALPTGESLAIYTRAADLTILLQNFTSDHNVLLAAIHKAIPRVRQPGSWYATDFDTLQQMIFQLRQLPGRKNVFWFSGGSRIFLRPDPASLAPTSDVRSVYDELEADRIAIYPIDARGLTTESPRAMTEQHLLMNAMADATGGQASYDNNGLAEIASHLVDTAGDFYTLTYRPDDLKLNNKWHKVKITVDGDSYHLRYRRGYFDDGNRTPPRRDLTTVLRAGGETVQTQDRDDPIIFQAQVLPSSSTNAAPAAAPATGQKPPTKNEVSYSVEYSLPFNAFSQQIVNGEPAIKMGVAILAFSNFGRLASHLAQEVTFRLNEEKIKSAAPSLHFAFHQQINLPKGQDYLYLAVWDTTNRRVGTLQLPLDVVKTK